MCGIVGFCGTENAAPFLLEGLTRLEYRGYDSGGIAVIDQKTPGQGPVIVRRVGKISVLKEAVNARMPEGFVGMGHTRWATHGGVTEANTHPHRYGQVTLIHNGIIENYQDLKERFSLTDLKSETDTEVAAAVFDFFFEKFRDPYEAICHATDQMKGSYAFGLIFDSLPDRLFSIRHITPLLAAHCEKGSFLSSDITVLAPYTQKFYVIPEDVIVTLTADSLSFRDLNSKELFPETTETDWSPRDVEKGDFEHFMLKEICETPSVIERTLQAHVINGLPNFEKDLIPDAVFRDVTSVRIIASGSAMHAGLLAQKLMERMLRIPVLVSVASEFRYEDPAMDEHTLVVAVSQSGETIDTLEALHLAGSLHARTLGIINAKDSAIAREADYVLYTDAGPEIAVASTKAYSAQLSALYLLCLRLAMVQGKVSPREARAFMAEFTKVPAAVNEVLDLRDHIRKAAHNAFLAKDAFFIGRGLDYPLAVESALKLKEVSYIHAEAYPGGELKHGPLALIDKGVPVVALATQIRTQAKIVSNMREVKARGAYVLLLGRRSDFARAEEASVYDDRIALPDLPDEFMPFLSAAACQLLAYFAGTERGLTVDTPRHLAKSVTVE